MTEEMDVLVGRPNDGMCYLAIHKPQASNSTAYRSWAGNINEQGRPDGSFGKVDDPHLTKKGNLVLSSSLLLTCKSGVARSADPFHLF